MKKLFAIAMLSAAASMAQANTLADGVAAWEKQDFALAHQIFSKLAKAGDPAAQVLLGEMYGYGEGVPEDMKQAQYWLNQAQAKGHKDAGPTLATMASRSARKADIARYVGGSDGVTKSLEAFGCASPVIPAMSTSKPEINAVNSSMTAWRACYERFGQQMRMVQPAGKAIPSDVAALMSVTELQMARAALDKTYAALTADASRQASTVIAASDAWYKQTQAHTVSMGRAKDDQSARRQRELDEISERARQAMKAASAGR